MRVAVTGTRGQVALSLAERAPHFGHHVVPVGRPELDLTRDRDSLRRALSAVSPEVIVSAAAYTAVDRAESEPDLAFAVNEGGAKAVAEAAKSLGVPLLHLSTDYVFDGDKPAPYLETDVTAPMSVYGASKLAGEQAVLAACSDCAIIRTAWVYSPFGSNFARTMLRLASEREEVAVVADQLGNPTSALDIADGIFDIASNLASSRDASLRGTFHMTAVGEATWADFAAAIFAAAQEVNGPTARVRPISTAEFPTAARRPANSRLDCSKLQRAHGVRLPGWRSSVGAVVHRLVGDSVVGEGSQR